MPQISKIRIVNFQYNDGKRLIADELFDFESESKGPSDVLINLVNGGGKSVLVQLMMQPILPKAKVAGRKIESFFTKATDHCYVVLEWALDNSPMKLMTGIAMAASDASSDPEAERGFQIKYYLFLSTYQNYQGKYHILSLPLSRKERGRYIPAAFEDVRNLAKKTSGELERFSSDDTVRWRDRLAQYGIVQNEWRMIEELNSNEDGLSKYFSNLKTSDAVIDRLIIPRIEEKQHHGASGDDSSLETMLISYARQFSRQQDILKEREVCSGFYSMLEETKADAEALWTENDAYEKSIDSLFAFSDALNCEITRQRDLSAQIEQEQSRIDQEIRHIRWEKASSDYYSSKENLEREEQKLQQAEKERKEAKNRLEEAKRRLRLLECAYYYGQLKDIENQAEALRMEISSRESQQQSNDRLASLRYSAFLGIRTELQRVLPSLKQAEEEKAVAEQAVAELEQGLISLLKQVAAAEQEEARADALLERQMQENDRLADELMPGAFRMFDGTFPEDELRLQRQSMEDRERTTEETISGLEEQIRLRESRREEIPQEIADANTQLRETREKLDDTERALQEYRTREAEIRSVFEKHGLNCERRFCDDAQCYLSEQAARTRASIEHESGRIQATEEALAAVKRGTLHIPGMLLEYLDSTSLPYISFEKYLLTQQEKGLLSKETALSLLENYPFAAYSVIVEKADLEQLEQEAADRWLPAVLPVLTASDVDAMLRGDAPSFSALASYAKDYFQDRDIYSDGLNAMLSRQSERKEQLESREKSLREDMFIVEAFSVYDQNTEAEMLLRAAGLKDEAVFSQERINHLQAELDGLKELLSQDRKELEQLNIDLISLRNQMQAFEEFINKLTEEEQLKRALDSARSVLKALRKKKTEAETTKVCQQELLRGICDTRNRLSEEHDRLKEGLAAISDAPEAEVIPGVWNELLSQYRTLIEAQSADLKRLHDDLRRLLKERAEKQREIDSRACEEADYKDLACPEGATDEARKAVPPAEILFEEAGAAYAQAVRTHGRAEALLESAAGELAEFGGHPLSPDEIGSAFESRITEKQTRFEKLDLHRKSVLEKYTGLQKIQGRTESAAEPYSPDRSPVCITLEEDVNAQLRTITQRLQSLRKTVELHRGKVLNGLRRMQEVYEAVSPDIMRAVSGMREYLSNPTVSGDRYYTLCEHIDANMHTTQLRISQIDTDLKEFHKTRGDLIHQCVIQGRQMYEGLIQLSNRSKVKVQDRRRRMILFDIPDAVDENIANAAIAAEIEKGTKEIADRMAEPDYAESEVRRIASRTVGSKRLLRRYIGLENITLKAYKIDRNPDNSGYRSWEQTQINNSGAEKFVVYFAVILALMAYTRDGYEDVGGTNRSVLILDNPFGPISSRHVLEPMFEISRNYHVQMICLSDISKSDIVSCFDLVIRAVVKPFALSNREQLIHEGNEVIEHGYYRSEQLELF